MLVPDNSWVGVLRSAPERSAEKSSSAYVPLVFWQVRSAKSAGSSPHSRTWKQQGRWDRFALSYQACDAGRGGHVGAGGGWWHVEHLGQVFGHLDEVDAFALILVCQARR